MKKAFALMLVLCMMLVSIPALAETDFSGTWYLIIADVTCGTFELKADGACAGTTVASGEEKELNGTWSAEGNAVTLTIGEQPLLLSFDGTDLVIGVQETAAAKDGVESGSLLKFSREPGKVTAEELSAYSTDGTLPEGKTNEDMEKVQAQYALLFMTAVEEAIIEEIYCGTWYLNMTGMTCGTFELNADGTCVGTSTVSGEKKLDGTWSVEENLVTLTIGGQSMLLAYDGTDLVIYAERDTFELASILKFSREPGITAEELNAYSTAGTIPEGKTKVDMENVQNQIAMLIIAAALLN